MPSDQRPRCLGAGLNACCASVQAWVRTLLLLLQLFLLTPALVYCCLYCCTAAVRQAHGGADGCGGWLHCYRPERIQYSVSLHGGCCQLARLARPAGSPSTASWLVLVAAVLPPRLSLTSLALRVLHRTSASCQPNNYVTTPTPLSFSHAAFAPGRATWATLCAMCGGRRRALTWRSSTAARCGRTGCTLQAL